ncbi:MAG: sugar transferase, partial [Trueperaceae bacterium]|nr:sugar transferase [Trueperaceae bacterium]
LLGWRIGYSAMDAADNALIAGLLLLAGPLMVYALGGYDGENRPLGSGPVELARLMLGAAVVLWLVMLMLAWRHAVLDVQALAFSWPLLGVGWFSGRIIQRRRLARRPENTLVVGSGPVAMQVVKLTRRHPEHGIRVVGLVDDDPQPTPDGAPPVVGGTRDLIRLLGHGNVKRVIVAFSSAVDDDHLTDALRTSPEGVRVNVIPRMWQLAGHDTRVDALGGMAMLEMTPVGHTALRLAVKRTFDVLLAGAILILTSPIMLLVALAVKLDSPGPALFRQTRVGRGGEHFEIMKFRTMRQNADTEGAALAAARADAGEDTGTPIAELVAALKPEDDPRITTLGRFLRRSSLDELPQLFNVIRGDMSIVGPRPLRPFEARALIDWQHQRHNVRPGITGIWQVLGRSTLPWDERMHLDYAYARNCSLRQDLRVLARTLPVVLSRDGSR